MAGVWDFQRSLSKHRIYIIMIYFAASCQEWNPEPLLLFQACFYICNDKKKYIQNSVKQNVSLGLPKPTKTTKVQCYYLSFSFLWLIQPFRIHIDAYMLSRCHFRLLNVLSILDTIFSKCFLPFQLHLDLGFQLPQTREKNGHQN